MANWPRNGQKSKGFGQNPKKKFGAFGARRPFWPLLADPTPSGGRGLEASQSQSLQKKNSVSHPPGDALHLGEGVPMFNFTLADPVSGGWLRWVEE